MARPSGYTDKLGKEICIRLMLGESLRSICLDESMPDKATVCRWLADEEKYQSFCDQYARARSIQAEMGADEIIDIADDGSNDWMERNNAEGECVGWQLNGENVQRSKLRVDARKWVASRLLPKKYGDRVTQEVTGKDGGPIEQDHHWKVEFVNPADAPSKS